MKSAADLCKITNCRQIPHRCRNFTKTVFTKDEFNKLFKECVDEALQYNLERVSYIVMSNAFEHKFEIEFTVTLPYQYMEPAPRPIDYGRSFSRYHIPETVHPFILKAKLVNKISEICGYGRYRSMLHDIVLLDTKIKLKRELRKNGYRLVNSPNRYLETDSFKISWENPLRHRLFRGIVRFIIIANRYRDAFYAPGGTWYDSTKKEFEQLTKKRKIS